MQSDRQTMCTSQPPQEGLHNTTAASPLHRFIATVSRRVGFTARTIVNTHKDAATVPWVTVCLSNLPNELLDIVALHLCGSKSILKLSCINTRFRRIAQYAMLRKLCVPRNGFRGTFEKLAADPDAVLKVCHLDLSKCRHGQNAHDQAHLVAILPSLKELTIWLSPHGDAFKARPLIRSPNHQHNSILPIQGLALGPLQERIQVLTIKSDPKYKQSTAHTIKLPGFRNLRSLTISMEHLSMPTVIGFYRPDGTWMKGRHANASKHSCLPLSLESLHLTSCTRYTFGLLHVFDNLDPGELRLRHTTLAFDMPTVPAIVLCLTSHTKSELLRKKTSRWLRRLKSLAHKHHHVFFSTTESVSFIEELEAATKLSNSEIALVAGTGLRLTDCVARNRKGFRARSSVESRLFLLHGLNYLQLFCSPTFDLSRWIKVIFFHGEDGVSSKLRGMADTFSFHFPLRANPQQIAGLEPDLTPAATLEKVVSFLALSKSTPAKRGGRWRNIWQEPPPLSLVFNGKVTEPPTNRFDLRSKFVAANFMYENWMWHLSPQVYLGAVGSGQTEARSAHNDCEDDTPVNECR